MSYALPQIDPNTSGAILNAEVPLSRYLDESYEAGKHDTILQSLNRMSEFSSADADQDSPILDAETANKKWGVGDLKFNEPVRESVARLMNQRKREEIDRNYFLSQGASAARFLPGMAASMLGSVSNPIDLGIMFMPFVGEEAIAAKATTTAGRALARRLVTRETLREVFPRAPALAESIINGTAGQALFEVPVFLAAKQDKSDYTLGQAGINIFAGGAFAAGIHGATRLFQSLGRSTRVEMARQALTQMLKDEPVQVHQYVKVDEGAIWARLNEQSDALAAEAAKMIDMPAFERAVAEKWGERVESPAIRVGDTILRGEDHRTIAETFIEANPDAAPYLASGEVNTKHNPALYPGDEGFITDKGRFISRDEAGQLVGLPDKGYNHLLWENDKLLSEQISTANPEQLGAAEFDRYNQLIEENPHLSKVDALKQIMAERQERRSEYLRSKPEIQELIARERQIAITNHMEDLKAEKFQVLKQEEIARQIKEGKILPPEEVQAKTPPEKFADAPEGEVDQEIASLEKDLKIEKTEEGAKVPEEKSPFKENESATAKLIASIDNKIAELNKPGTKSFTGVLGIEPLIGMVGKEVAKGLLVAVREALKLGKPLLDAIELAISKIAADRLRYDELSGNLKNLKMEERFTSTIPKDLEKLKNGYGGTMPNPEKVRRALENVIEVNRSRIRREPMSFDMPANQNVKGVPATTMGAILQGWRTATTRHWPGGVPQPGDLIEFSGKGNKATVIVTGSRNVKDVIRQYHDTGITYSRALEAAAADLSVPEGWTQKQMHQFMLEGRTVNPESVQVEFKLLKIDPQTKAIDVAIECVLRKMI